jgi:3-oxoacyl-[acyl-carrier-protein] synthase-1
MRDGTSALTPNDFGVEPLSTWIGRVVGVESVPLPDALAAWECRNDRLAWLGLNADSFIDAVHAARERHGAGGASPLVLGTSTSSIGATEDPTATRPDGPLSRRTTATRSVHTPHSLGSSSARRSPSKVRA